MKILADIGHLKNAHIMGKLLPLLESKGHILHIVYRQRERMGDLCRALGLHGQCRGRGGEGPLGKLAYLLKADLFLIRLAAQLKPDLLLSFASPYLAHVASLRHIPMVVFDDTEDNPIIQRIYLRSASALVVPSCFKKEFDAPMFRFNGYFEQVYLHPNIFTPDLSMRDVLGLGKSEKLVVLRTVSWRALHDFGHRGLSTDELARVVAELSRHARVIISAEGDLPANLEPLRLRINPEKFHDVMAMANLIFSEGATIAAEGAMLGVPTVHVSDLKPGYISELETRYGLIRSFPHADVPSALYTANSLLSAGNGARHDWQRRRDSMLAESSDVLEFMIRAIETFVRGSSGPFLGDN